MVANSRSAPDLYISEVDSTGAELEFNPGSDDVDTLRGQLMQEHKQRLATLEYVKFLEDAIANGNASAASSTAPPKRFGVSTAKPYRGRPLPQTRQQSPTHMRRVGRKICLPALRTLPQAPPQPPQGADEVADVATALDAQRMATLTQVGQSRARTEAINKLDSKGLDTWQIRKAEKVSKLQELNTFGESMWDSFFDWQEDATSA